jgi:hypothetical protein
MISYTYLLIRVSKYLRSIVTVDGPADAISTESNRKR